MAQRLAAILALLAFAVCLYVGGVEAGNPFTTTVGRALVAMGGTYVVGLIARGDGTPGDRRKTWPRRRRRQTGPRR